MVSRTERTYYVCRIIVCQLFWLSRLLLIIQLLLDVLLCLCDHNLHCFSYHGVCRYQDEELVFGLCSMDATSDDADADRFFSACILICIQFCFVIRQFYSSEW